MNPKIIDLDARRQVVLPGDHDSTIDFCTHYFIDQAKQAIVEKGFFTIALSGGSTPKAILQKLSAPPYAEQVEWDKILFFFGDERCVPPDDKDSNYKMAMDNALEKLHVPSEHIFRMVAEKNAEENALAYEELIKEKVPNLQFDLITLGMGDDGHTASLFPHTDALKEEKSLVVVNEVPQKKTQRMTLSYPCINQAHQVCFFVLGDNKAEVLPKVLLGDYKPLDYPSQKIGTDCHKALWIVDQNAAAQLQLP